MNPNADIIRALIIGAGLGSASGSWPVFVGFLPDRPDNAILVMDTAGKLDGRIMRTGEQIAKPGIQVRLRSLDYAVAQLKAKQIALMLDSQMRSEVSLDGMAPADLDGIYTIHNISRSGDILPMGVEEGDRPRHHFSVNAMVTVSKNE